MISADILRRLFRYEPETGEFFHLTRAARRVKIGDVAGSVNSQGYRQIRIQGRTYKAHRLAWLYVYGAWPHSNPDHINGRRSDNRMANLRLASRSQNLANSSVWRRGKDIPKGVSSRKSGRWIARVQRGGKSHFLGSFSSLAEASAAYAAAAHQLFGPYARTA